MIQTSVTSLAFGLIAHPLATPNYLQCPENVFSLPFMPLDMLLHLPGMPVPSIFIPLANL